MIRLVFIIVKKDKYVYAIGINTGKIDLLSYNFRSRDTNLLLNIPQHKTILHQHQH